MSNDIYETQGGEEKQAMETLQLIKDGFYNLDRPSSVVLRELVQAIKLIEEHVNVVGAQS